MALLYNRTAFFSSSFSFYKYNQRNIVLVHRPAIAAGGGGREDLWAQRSAIGKVALPPKPEPGTARGRSIGKHPLRWGCGVFLARGDDGARVGALPALTPGGRLLSGVPESRQRGRESKRPAGELLFLPRSRWVSLPPSAARTRPCHAVMLCLPACFLRSRPTRVFIPVWPATGVSSDKHRC